MTTAILTHDDLRSTAPSIFATTPCGGVSANYRFVPSIEVLGMMADQGFHPIIAHQSRSRIPGKGVFTKHMVRFRHVDHLDTRHHAEVPELVLVNSHDRTSAYKLFAGILRVVCTNGLICCSEDYGSFSLRHSGSRSLHDQIIETTGELIGVTRQAFDDIREWKGIGPTRPQQLAFAESALELRGAGTIEPSALLEPRRQDDATKPDGTRDIFTTMNTVQEHLIKGGVRGKATTGRRMTTKPVKAIDADIKTNRALWMLASRMVELVG